MNRNHRVLLVTSRFPYGAKELFLREEILELSRYHDLSIAAALPTREAVCEEWLEPMVFPRLRLASPAVFALAIRAFARSPLASLRAAAAVVARPRSKRAKLKNLLIVPKALAVAEYAHRARIEHVHAYWLSSPATVAYIVSVVNDISWSATGHRYDLVDYNIRSTGVPNAGFVDTATFVRAISQRGCDQINAALDASPRRPPAVLEHIGVRVPLEPARNNRPRVFRLLCNAGMEPIKGHDVLLEAIAIARAAGEQVHCTFAGTGYLHGALEQRAQALGLERNVTFRGVVPHPVLMKELAGSKYDAAILTSRDTGPDFCEGIPVSLIEAMAAGLPVIATRSGAVGELVNEKNGVLCEPENAAEVAQAILRLARDPALCEQLSRESHRTVAQAFDVVETARRMAERMIHSADPLGRMAQDIPGERGLLDVRSAALLSAAEPNYNRDDATAF